MKKKHMIAILVTLLVLLIYLITILKMSEEYEK